MKVALLTLLYNRHTLIERVVRCFLDQDYEGECTLFIYNTGERQELGTSILAELKPNHNIILINNQLDMITGDEYQSVGEKYRDALRRVVNSNNADINKGNIPDIVNITDSDDLFLPNHISEGVRGMQYAERGGYVAYKPKQSFYRTKDSISLQENNFEGSIFMKLSHLREYGFVPKTVTYHQQWLDPLIENCGLCVGIGGAVPTWIYTWGEDNGTWKTSGGADDYDNFLSTQRNSVDVGDIVIDPVSREEIEKYYREAKSVLNA